MFLDEINKPYPWEKEFYKKNNIPEWECNTHETKDLGIIYKSENGSYVKAIVKPAPAQFWDFTVYCAADKKTYTIQTGSGGLQTYFDTMKNIATGMILISSGSEVDITLNKDAEIYSEHDCPGCDAVVHPSDKFCHSCGAKINWKQ